MRARTHLDLCCEMFCNVQSIKGSLLAEVSTWPQQHHSSHRYWIWVGILLGAIVCRECLITALLNVADPATCSSLPSDTTVPPAPLIMQRDVACLDASSDGSQGHKESRQLPGHNGS